MIEAAKLVHRSAPDVRFAIASFKPHQAEIARNHGLRVESHRHEIYGACTKPETCEHRRAKAS